MISLEYLVLYKHKKSKSKKELIKLRDTRGSISFALRISFPNKDYKPKSKPRNNKEENKLRVRKWTKDHPDRYQKHLEWVRQWRRRNRKKILAYNQKWRDNNREQYRAQQRDYARRKAAKKKESVNKSTKSGRKTTNS